MFLVNLAISDFLMLFVMPLTVINSYKGGPALGVSGENYFPALAVIIEFRAYRYLNSAQRALGE
jgi:hypothetical protein